MSIGNAVVLGLVQGIAEFLPISSSGHLALLNNLFHMSSTEDGHMLFDVLLHLGTLISICVVYWSDIIEIVDAVTNNCLQVVFLPVAEMLSKSILESSPKAFHNGIVMRGAGS